MDHVASIPFVADTVGWMREKPITLYATRETLDICKAHLFNWKLWPDFAQIPEPQRAGRCAIRRSRSARPSRWAAARSPRCPRITSCRPWAFISTRAREPGFHRRHDHQRRAVGAREQDRQPALPHHRNRAFRPGARARDRLEAPVPEPARRGAREAHAPRGDLHHAPEAARSRADHGRDRGARAPQTRPGCCATTRCSSFEQRHHPRHDPAEAGSKRARPS